MNTLELLALPARLTHNLVDKAGIPYEMGELPDLKVAFSRLATSSYTAFRNELNAQNGKIALYAALIYAGLC